MELANSIVTLQPGMYILRHPKTGMPPLSISRAAARSDHNGQIQALYTQGTDGAVLRDGRDCIVMQVTDAPVDLLVTAYLEKAGAAVPALKIDKIRLDDGEDTVVGKRLEMPSKGISLIGHIERIGDVLAKPGERLGDPAQNLRLEGFQLVWPDKPAGVDVEYSAKVEGAPNLPPVTSGVFCGTKNAARRLVGIAMRMVGDQADQYSINGEATFSGGFTKKLADGAVAAGPTGVEHLTSLRIDVTRTTSKARTGAWGPSARTKVFKSPKGGKAI